MGEVKIRFSCGFCGADHVGTVILPEGWDARDEIDVERRVFCPDHSAIAAFEEAQCPGCVEGWENCALWRAFGDRNPRQPLTNSDLDLIESGLCPRRTNGTRMISAGSASDVPSMEAVDLSERAPVEAGKALVAGIMAFMARFGTGRKQSHG